MERPKEIWVKNPEAPKSPDEYLRQEMEKDLNAFPQHLQPYVEQFLSGKRLRGAELEELEIARKNWWRAKYGVDFNIEKARNEILLRNNAPEQLEKIHPLQSELLAALKAGDKKAVEALKEKYLEMFPDRLESIEALFGFQDFLEKNARFREIKDTLGDRERMNYYRDFTEYQYLLTHFILTHADDRKFLENYWEITRTMAKDSGRLNDFNILRRGLVSQAATFLVVEKIGQKPALSHPDEDAFSAIDLWVGADTALQVKGWNEEVPALVETDNIAFPAIEVSAAKKTTLLNAHDFRHWQQVNRQFLLKVEKYAQRKHREIKGQMMMIPYGKIDFVTGEPDPSVVEFFEKKLKAPGEPEELRPAT